MTIHLDRCLECGAVCFPARLACLRCSGERFEPVPVPRGTVLGATETAADVAVVDVEAAGARLVASCAAAPEPGQEMPLYSGRFDRAAQDRLFVPGAELRPGPAAAETAADEGEG